MKRLTLSLILTILMAPVLFAETIKVQIDELWYNLDTEKRNASVTYSTYAKPNAYENYTDGLSDVLIIPSEVRYNNINYSVTSIGSYALSYTRSLNTVVISEGIKIIENAAFRTSSIKSIYIPGSVTRIGYSVEITNDGDYMPFYGCTLLKELYLLDGDETLNLGANYSDNALKSHSVFGLKGLEFLYLGRNLSYLTYDGCGPFEPDYFATASLKKVIIGSKVTNLGSNLLYPQKNIEEVFFCPLTTIRRGSFCLPPKKEKRIFWIPYDYQDSYQSLVSEYSYSSSDNKEWLYDTDFAYLPLKSNRDISVLEFPCKIKKIEKIEIPEKIVWNNKFYDVVSIENQGFINNEEIISVSLTQNIKTIGSEAFGGCSSLSEINIPGSVTTLGDNAFQGTTSLKEIMLERGDAELSVNQPFAGSEVESLFLGRDIKGKLGIGNTLQSLQVGSNVTYIDDNQFNGCTNLNSVKFFEGNLKTIYSGSFQGCSSLKEITIPNTVESIKSGAFKDCTALGTVNLSSKLTEIADETFSRCRILNSIKLPEGITSIGNSAFCGCSKLDNINLPDWITKIGDEAFAGCAFRNITLPQNLKSIGESAFHLCEDLISITIPNSVISIGKNAFWECGSLGEAILSDKLTSIPESCFSQCELQRIIIPDKVTEIENDAFYGNNLNSIELPTSLTTIGDYAFSYAGPVSEITIPANVTKIGKHTFYGCDNLITVNSLNSVPPTCTDAQAFSQSTYKNAVLWVPAPSVEDYMTFVGWKEFKNYDALEAIASIKLSGSSNILRINKTMDLEATVIPSNISTGNLKWSSSNPIVATVDNNGRVKALSPGYVVITAKSQDIIATEGTYELTVMDYLLGDSNESDDVTITDAVNIASYVMGEDPAVFNFYASDVNQSNDITLADASGVISIILDATYATLANSARKIKTADNDVLRADDFSVYYGETANVPVSLESDNDYVALQADVTATNGLTISDVLPSSCLEDTHMFITKRLADDSVRIIIYSPALNEIPYNGNSLFDVVVGGNPGEGASINITNILATDTHLEEHQIGFEGGNCESLSTGIADIPGSLLVKTEPGEIIVGGAEGYAVTVYSINGMVIASTKIAGDEERFSIIPGAYIITVGSHVEKVIVR